MWLIPVAAFLLPFSLQALKPPERNLAVAGGMPSVTVHTNQIQKGNIAPRGKEAQEKNTAAGAAQAKPVKPPVLLIPQEQIREEGRRSIPFAELLSLIWLSTAGCIGIIRIGTGLRFRRKLKIIGEVPPEQFQKVFYAVKQSMGISSDIELRLIRAQVSPFLTGIRSPVIMLPESVTMEELFPVLCHELTHFKRKDLWYRALVHLVTALHWFNPVVYWMDWEIKRQMELACDEAAAGQMEPEQQRQYGISILTLMKRNKHFAKDSAFLAESSSGMKQRLEVIMTKKRKTKWAGLVSGVLALGMLCSTAAMAAAVNDQNPVKSAYAFNFLKDTGRAYYQREAPVEQWGTDDGTGQGRGTRDIVLINTPVYKNFYVNMEIENYTLDNGSKKPENRKLDPEDGRYYEQQTPDEEKKVVSRHIEVKMDELLKVLDGGNDWVGLFTVTIGGTVVLDKAQGTISNIPSDKKKGLTYLSIHGPSREDGGFDMQSMNFNFSGDDLIKLQKEKSKKAEVFEQDANTKVIAVTACTKSVFPETIPKREDSKIDPDYAPTILFNEFLGKIDCFFGGVGMQYGIVADLNQTYAVSKNGMKGTFFIQSGIYKYDEFQGTFSGLNGKPGETAVLRSDDGTYEFVFTLGEPRKESQQALETVEEEPVPDPSDEEYPYYQYRHSKKETRSLGVEEFPFSVSLSPEKDRVTLTYKPAKQYEGWFATMATYNASNEQNIWEEKSSKAGENTFTFSVLNDGSRHYINVTQFNADPYAQWNGYELIFTISEGQLLMQQCSLMEMSNENYQGDGAREFLKQTVYQLKKAID